VADILDPRHGIHNPNRETPPRPVDSIRRTSVMRMARPDGLDGPLVLTGSARDLYTPPRGDARVLGEARVELVLDYMGGRTITAISSQPDLPGVKGLVGRKAVSGFRAALSTVFETDVARRSLLHALLDDVPVTTLISGHMISALTPADEHYWQRRGEGRELESTLRNANVCEGWREGGTIMLQLRSPLQTVPTTTGPPAPDITVGDPQGWHTLPVMETGNMRRLRRTDVAVGDGIEIDAMFRDSFKSLDGLETVIHEYNISACAEPGDERIVEISSDPRVLPWLECPGAAASAGRLIGSRLASLRSDVRSDLVGLGTCTHLNDALRGLADVVELAAQLERMHS
jgi:hypothetical protein